MLAATACSETTGTGGGAGLGGGGGDGGSSGVGGDGGTAGTGGDPLPCQATTDRCQNGIIEPHEPCCEQPVPEQENACDGSESTVNPASCTPTGNPITYRLTVMEVEDDCNVGYDLDGCNGESCVPSGLAPGEGMSGVDNALAGFAPTAEGVGGNLGRLNKQLSDALCGLTGGDCGDEIATTEIRFVIDANPMEGCANLTVLTDGEPSAHVLNLSDDGCMSGRLGTIPLPLVGGTYSLDNTVVRTTVSPAGFSHGRLGGTMDSATMSQVIGTFLPAGAVATIVLDINASTPPTINAGAMCNGMSATFRIAGLAE